MTTAFEAGLKEQVYHFFRCGQRNKACRQANNICVVVLAGKGRQVGLPANGGSYALVFVRGNGNAVSASADKNATARFTFFNGISYRMREIRIVYRLKAGGTKIFH